MITLAGVGGVGKTRLALEIAAQVASDFENGVVFVPLEALTEPEQVVWALSRAVGVSESGERLVFEDLKAHLAEKHTLVCLDNCEHVLQAASQIADLLIACPRLHILAWAERSEPELKGPDQAMWLKRLEQAVQYALEPSKQSSQDAGKKTTRRAYPAGPTAREVEVLGLVAQGLSDAEVSESLVISPRTVNAHLTSIYNKLGVNSRVAATRFAVDHGLVEQKILNLRK